MPPITEEKDWRIEDDCLTLMQAEKIKKDGERYKKAIKRAKEKQAELNNILANEPLSKKGD